MMPETKLDHNFLKKLLAVIAATFVLTIIIFGWRDVAPVPPYIIVSPDQDNEIDSVTSAMSLEFPTKASPSVRDDASVSIQLEWTNSIEQMQELNLWAQERGKVSFPVQGDDYDTYDNMTLQSLAENNHDVKAMTILGVKLRGDTGLHWLRLAAIYDSSYALTWAGSISTAVSLSAPEEVKRAGLIDALTYKKVAEIRGDFYSSRGINMDHFETQLRVRLTDEDKALAEKKARPLYDELESQRIQLGLGKFDNSVPPAVEAYYRKFIF
ncbi:MAG TPA: hypothetical protein VL995_13415 [Cellvibrio sp.]|nr:hypothetical protein [Cellvibrio sp.]